MRIYTDISCILYRRICVNAYTYTPFGNASACFPGDLSLMVSRLEDRCELLERNVRAESDAAGAGAGRAKTAEARFARLVVWAREEEGRRLQAEERLRKACEAGQVLEARNTALEEEVSRGESDLSSVSRTVCLVLCHCTVSARSTVFAKMRS